MKELVAEYLANKIVELSKKSSPPESFILGLGSGTTAALAIKKTVAKLAGTKPTFKAIGTSYQSIALAQEAGIDVLPLSSGVVPTFAFDGADEVDLQHRIIKGQGAAMTPEKIVARRSGGVTIIITAEKLVAKLGSKFPVPVEVLQIAVPDVWWKLKALPGVSEVKLREGTGKIGPVTTELGNFILDVTYTGEIPEDAESTLKLIPGVVESGIFTNDVNEVIVAKDGALFRFLKGGALEPV